MNNFMDDLQEKIFLFSVAILFIALAFLIIGIGVAVWQGKMPMEQGRINAEVTLHQTPNDSGD